MNERLNALLSEPNFAQLGTVNSDGSPHIDTVWFDYSADTFAIATTIATRKARNLSRNPAGFVVVTNRHDPYEQAQLRVVLDRIEPDDDLKVCDAIAVRYTGHEFPQRNHRNRVVIYLKVVSCRYHKARV